MLEWRCLAPCWKLPQNLNLLQPEARLPVLWGEVFVLADFGHSHVPCGWKARSAAGDTHIKVLLLSSFQMSLKNPFNRHSELLLHR